MKKIILLILFLIIPCVVNADIQTGLIGWWKLNEGSGTIAYDSSGNGHNVTLNNSGWVAGKIYQYALGGGSYYGTITLTVPHVSTVCAWAYLTTLSNIPLIANNSSPDTWFLQVGGGSHPWQFEGADTGSAATTGAWTYVCGVDNGSTAYLYVNNSNIATASTQWTTSANFQLGSMQGGYLQDVRLYNRALSSTDLTQLYNYRWNSQGFFNLINR